MKGEAIGCGGDAVPLGQGLVRIIKLCLLVGFCSLSSTTSSSRRQCDGGGRSVYCLFATPLIVFGALSGLRKWCQRRLTARSCWRRHIQYTSRLVFAFFDSIIGGVFLSI